jgi:hypothetical protein
VVRVKPIWSADNRENILAYIADRPVYQALKRLMNIINVGLQYRGPVICSDGQREAFGHFLASLGRICLKSVIVHRTIELDRNVGGWLSGRLPRRERTAEIASSDQ